MSVDFTTVSTGDKGPRVNFIGGSVVSTDGGSFVVRAPSDGAAGLCATRRSSACRGDFEVIFFGPVRDFAFALGAASASEPIAVTLYNGEKVVGTAVANSTAPRAFGSTTVTRASFDYGGNRTTGGVSTLGGLSFTPQNADLVALSPKDVPKDLSVVTLSPVQSEILDFTEIAPGRSGETTLRLKNALITQIGGGEFFVYGAGEYGLPDTGGFCALRPGFVCTGDVLVSFLKMVKDVSIEAFFVKPTDSARILLFSGDTLLATRRVLGNGVIDFFGYEAVTHMEIRDASRPDSRGIASGIAFGNLRFSEYVAVIPLPASGFGLLAGLAMLLAAARIRRKQET